MKFAVLSPEKKQLIEELKTECRLLGEAFSNCWYREHPNTLRHAIEKYRARRLRNQDFEAIRIQNLLNEPIPYVGEEKPGWSVFFADCGGGRHNVRSGKSFS